MLLTSIAFAVSAVTLARRKVLTRELPAVEGLARVDVLCIDKTGTITEPRPAFERFEAVDGVPDGDGAAAARTGAVPTPAAMPWLSKCWARWPPPRPCATRLSTPSGRTFPTPPGGRSKTGRLLLRPQVERRAASPAAAPGCWARRRSSPTGCGADCGSAERARSRAAELADEGLRVLLLSHTDERLARRRPARGLAAAGLVILSERVRADAPETLAYFRKEGVEIKVISGDNPATVATIAAKAGVPGAEQAVDARTLPEGEDELAETHGEHHRLRPGASRPEARPWSPPCRAAVTPWP